MLTRQVPTQAQTPPAPADIVALAMDALTSMARVVDELRSRRRIRNELIREIAEAIGNQDVSDLDRAHVRAGTWLTGEDADVMQILTCAGRYAIVTAQDAADAAASAAEADRETEISDLEHECETAVKARQEAEALSEKLNADLEDAEARVKNLEAEVERLKAACDRRDKLCRRRQQRAERKRLRDENYALRQALRAGENITKSRGRKPRFTKNEAAQ